MSIPGLVSGGVWSALAREAADRAGFQAMPHSVSGDAFNLSSEIAPSVDISFQRITFTEVAPQAILGVYAEAFEVEWQDRLVRSGLKMEWESPPLGLYCANIASLRERPWLPASPTEEDLAPLQDWLDRLFAYARRLPSSVAELAESMAQDRIVDKKASHYLGHPVKMRGFFQWVERNYSVRMGENLLAGLEDRTEPYDVDIMLGPP